MNAQQIADRIRLAEAMGRCTRNHDVDMDWGDWGKCPECGIRMDESNFRGFDPFTDANDCEALIRWLADEKHITVTVTFGRGVRFDHCIGTKSEVESDDWKRTVCQGALEVIE